MLIASHFNSEDLKRGFLGCHFVLVYLQVLEHILHDNFSPENPVMCEKQNETKTKTHQNKQIKQTRVLLSINPEMNRNKKGIPLQDGTNTTSCFLDS